MARDYDEVEFGPELTPAPAEEASPVAFEEAPARDVEPEVEETPAAAGVSPHPLQHGVHVR